MSEKFQNTGTDVSKEKLQTQKKTEQILSPEELRVKVEALTKTFDARLDTITNLSAKDKERLKSEFKAFILDSAANRLPSPLSEYSVAAADTDGEPGLDSYEFQKYTKGLEEAFRLMTEAGGIERLRVALSKFEADAKGSFFVKNFALFSRHAANSPDKPTNYLTERYMESVSNIPPEEARRLLNTKLGDNPNDFMRGLIFAIGTKAPIEVFEVMGRLVYDAVKALPQFVEYSALAIRSSFPLTPLERKEMRVGMSTILDDNTVVGLLALCTDGLAAGANELFGTNLASDGEINRARELLHRMGNPLTWTPEGVKDALLVLVPIVTKIARMRNARKGSVDLPPIRNPETGPRVALDLSNYDTPEKLAGLKKRLGLPETATATEIEKAYLEKRTNLLEQYAKLGKENLARIGKEFVEKLRQMGVKNPERVIADEIKAVQEAYEKGELLIVHIHNKADIPGMQKKGFLSPYELSDTPFAQAKYGIERMNAENKLGALGLDPRYITVLAYKEEIIKMSQKYSKDMGTTFPLKDFEGAAGVTMYDSMLLGKTSDGPKPFMFSIQDALDVRALKNIENRYSIGYKKQMEGEATSGKHGGMKEMYRNMPDFVEIQVFGNFPFPEGKTAPVTELTKSLQKAPKDDLLKTPNK